MIQLLQLILALLIFVAILVILIALRSRKHAVLDADFFKDEWAKVLANVQVGEQGWRLAIIDADKLLDHALKQLGAKGESMSDRLREREKTFSRYNNLWSAHKLRNRLVHEPGVTLSKQLTSKALKEFQLALKELGAL